MTGFSVASYRSHDAGAGAFVASGTLRIARIRRGPSFRFRDQFLSRQRVILVR
jgi:hypothetical protein